MHRKPKLAKISAFALALTLNFAGVSIACGPDYPEAVLFSWNHPDLPLKSFTGGNLGVIFNTWAKSYLCVAYRYLDGFINLNLHDKHRNKNPVRVQTTFS